MGNQLTSTFSCSPTSFPSIPSLNLARRQRGMKARVLGSSEQRESRNRSERERETLNGYEGVFIPLPPKLAVVHLSSGDSKEFSGQSKHVRTFWKIFRILRTICRESTLNYFHVECKCKSVSHRFVRSS